MSNLLSKAADFLTNPLSGIGATIVDTVKGYFPPSMSEAEKAELSMRITQSANEQANKAAQIAIEEQAEFNQRIKDMEGTASDLKAIPIVGTLILFLRGCQRPAWGYSTLYIDFMVFSGKWSKLTEIQESALWVINLLVLGFLFGERAIKNVTPLIERMIKAKVGAK